MVARALWRSEALRVVPWLRPCTRLRLVLTKNGGGDHKRRLSRVHYIVQCTVYNARWRNNALQRVSDQGPTLRASDLHNARANILNPFNSLRPSDAYMRQ